MYNGKRYSKADFEAEFEFIYGQAPTPIRYTTQWSYDNRGTQAVKIVKDDEPDAVYAGTIGWDDDEDDPAGYTVYRVIWSDDAQIYQEDTTFESRYFSVEEMKENGYHVAMEEVDEKQELTVWNSNNFSDPDGYHLTRTILRRRSAPDDLFAEMGYYSMDEIALGIFMFRVHYDPQADDFYIMDDAYDDPNEYYRESYENLENDTGDFYYDIQTVNKPIELRFTNRYFTPDSYLGSATQVAKDDEAGAVYAYNDWSHYEGEGEYSDWHTLYKLSYNQSVGCYFTDESFDNFDFQDPASLVEMGYHVVMSERPLDFVIQGQVSRGLYDIYTDNNGTRYYTTYRNVYSFTEDDLITLNGEQYYYGTLVPGLSRNDLNDTLHNVVTENYRYWIAGPEYHHLAGEAGSLFGTAVSFLDEDEAVTIQLLQNDTVIKETSVTGLNANYTISDVPAGAYTVRVTKKNHATIDYSVSVSGDTEQNVRICPIGDVTLNGVVDIKDVNALYKHVMETKKLSDPYALDCGNVAKSFDDVDIKDVNALYKHVMETRKLY